MASVQSSDNVSLSGCKIPCRHAHSPRSDLKVVTHLTPLRLFFSFILYPYSLSFLPGSFDNALLSHFNQFSNLFAVSFEGMLAAQQGPAPLCEDTVLWKPSCCNHLGN